MAFRKTTRTLLLILLSALIFAAACGDEKKPITPEQAQAFVEAWAPTVEGALSERTEGASIQPELEARMEAEASREAAKTSRDEPPYAQMLRKVYKELDHMPQLVEHGRLNARGNAIWEAVQAVEDHALDPQDYPLAEIRASLQALEAKSEGIDPDAFQAGEAEKKFALTYVTGRDANEFEPGEASHEAMTEALLEAKEGERLKAAMADYETVGVELAAESAKLEYLLALSLARYARQMKHYRVREVFIHPRHDDFYNDPETRRPRPDKAEAAYLAGVIWRRAAALTDELSEPVAINHARIEETLREVLTGDEPEQAVRGLWPSQPQYEGLLAEYARYRKIVADGGWEKIAPARRLGPGDRSATAKALKVRLQAEGYLPADATIDDHYDEALEEAVKAYQQTHQMDVTGKPHNMFWSSLNVPAERRAEQLAMNLRRWRDSNVRHDQDEAYVFINVPDFTLEMWEEQERTMRFAVVVGNNDLVENKETEEKHHANRTPVPLAAYIDRAIYNPYWNVTPRVRTNEILPEVKKWVEAKYAAKREARRKKAQEKARWSAFLGGGTGGATEQPEQPEQPEQDTALTAPAAPSAPVEEAAPVAGEETQEAVAQQGGKRISDGSGDVPAGRDLDFPYIDPATGEVDVSVTFPGHIPGWYAENDYEVMYPGKKWEYVRMTPGEHNALGLVKVIFPNLHDVYLHDTNAKALFSRAIRAFSHGCMRMHKPLDFAEHLLRRDELYEASEIPKVLREGTYLPVFLKRRVPVYVEYYTVRVDEDGRANFLADIYDYDHGDGRLPGPEVEKTAEL